MQLPCTKETELEDLVEQGKNNGEKVAEKENELQRSIKGSLLLSLQPNTDQHMNLRKLPSQGKNYL